MDHDGSLRVNAVRHTARPRRVTGVQ